MYRYFNFLPLLFLIYSCSTLPVANDENSEESTTKNIIQKTAVYQGINEFEKMLDLFDTGHLSYERDIDSRDWLMQEINFRADKDQLAVQRIYEDLSYRNWSDEEKTQYLETILPFLLEDRETLLEEIAYLINHSFLLSEMPWMVRDFYDDRSEFSYWYLIYMGRSIYPFWLDDSVIPTMLNLIPEDRITAVSYLWMKNPENLITMKSEIYNAGYPWSRLIYLIEISEFIKKEIERLIPKGEARDSILAGNLI